MNDNEFNPIEYLSWIKHERGNLLEKLYRSGEIKEYILYLHQRMIEKYPEMIIEVITDDMDMEQGE